jgi:diguanylate cyclase (GGDEF)-like protein/PAS domain S-box-containing protein
MRTAAKLKVRKTKPEKRVAHGSSGAHDTWKNLTALGADWRWELDREHRITAFQTLRDDVNDLLDPSACIGHFLWDIGFDVQREGGRDAWQQQLQSQTPFRDVVLGRTTTNSEEYYISISGEPRFDAAKRFIGYHGIARDISGAQRRHENLVRFRDAMDRCGDSIYLVDRSTLRFVDVNATASEKMGYSRDELLRMGPADLLKMPSEEIEKNYDTVIAAGARGLRTESLARAKDGRESVAEMHRRPLRVGNRWLVVSIARDITRRKRAEQAAVRLGRMYAALSATEEAILRTKSPEELYQRVCNAAVDGGKFLTTVILLKEPESPRLRVVAGSGVGLTTWRQAEISSDDATPIGRGLVGTACRTGQPCVSQDFMNDERTRPWHDLAQQHGVAAAAAVPIRRADATTGVMLFYSDEKRAFDDEIVKLLGRMVESVAYALDNFDRETERIRSQERIQYLATHDGLTGLPNRAMFNELLRLGVETGRRYERKFAVLFVDLDRFKFVNDTLGHEAGDVLLKEMSTRFKECLRASDVVARLGGDEFVFLIQEVGDAAQVTTVARKVLSAALRPVEILGQECRVTASVGIAMYPADATDEQSLMKNADMAMYLAKEEGKNNFQFYSKNIKSQSLERMAIETQLRRALDNNEFTLHYQPKMDSKSGQINGVEALLRWQNRELGSVSPMQFIPVAEETGMIIPIGRWVLRSACAQNVAWQRAGLPAICVAVNLSMRQFADPDLVKDIAATLEETGLPSHLLELELTESMVMHNVERAVKLLTTIKGMGVRLAIDDFGTGYSSLAQIKRFPIDTLKVDRSFIREIPNDTEDRAIAEAIIAMGKTLSLTVVAEGVETKEQEQFLRERACDEMQGYYFSRPTPPEEFEKLLRKTLTMDGGPTR